MTIGIGATGSNAGLAVFKALEAAERVGTGAIGGFAVFAALDAEGGLRLAETQRGGTKTLFTDGERTGGPPPEDIAAARFAAVMSSGPDRPDPLMQFLAVDPRVGLVTGHRLPNTLGPDGVAMNAAVLACMARGMSAKAALDAVLGANPDVDAGMIALGPDAGIAARNSTLVSSDRAAGEIIVTAGTPVIHGPRNRVLVDAENKAVSIESENAALTSGRHNCAAIYLGAEVVKDGTVIGHTLMEPNVMVEDGSVQSLSGQSEVRIPFAGVEKKG
jgi:hypothetical protein